MLREIGKCLVCLICCVFCVLLVPSAAWSADGETQSSEASPSSSPASESASPSAEPTPSDASSPSPAGPSSGPSEAVESSEPTGVPEPSPTATETVYVVTDPPAPEQSAALDGEGATVVTLRDEDWALIGLVSGLIALGVGARIVGSFGAQ